MTAAKGGLQRPDGPAPDRHRPPGARAVPCRAVSADRPLQGGSNHGAGSGLPFSRPWSLVSSERGLRETDELGRRGAGKTAAPPADALGSGWEGCVCILKCPLLLFPRGPDTARPPGDGRPPWRSLLHRQSRRDPSESKAPEPRRELRGSAVLSVPGETSPAPCGESPR